MQRRATLMSYLAWICAGVWCCAEAHACRICVAFPQQTLADRLLECEHVVLARENPSQPFSFQAIKVLKGDADADADFDLFVDSVTRRTLDVHLNHVVILVRPTADDSWRSLGLASPVLQQVAERILANGEAWMSQQDAKDRYAFFAELLGHSERRLHELAYLEIGRAPYRTIKRIAPLVPRQTIAKILNRREYIEWRPLAILLIAQNASDSERELIERNFRDAGRFSSSLNLAAWATAMIEINGTSVIEDIESTYFGNAARSEQEIDAITLALSVHGQNGTPELRERIVQSYGVALARFPRVATLVVSDLQQWNRREYRSQLVEILEKEGKQFSQDDLNLIKQYLE